MKAADRHRAPGRLQLSDPELPLLSLGVLCVRKKLVSSFGGQAWARTVLGQKKKICSSRRAAGRLSLEGAFFGRSKCACFYVCVLCVGCRVFTPKHKRDDPPATSVERGDALSCSLLRKLAVSP